MSASETIVLAGGCFWCTEAVFKEVRGVLDIESGYSNGQATAPTYEQVCTGATGCAEVVKLVYDPAQISTRQILEIFFLVHDPTQLNRQGPDHGPQYRSAVFTSDPAERSAVQAYIAQLNGAKVYRKAIATTVEPLPAFYPAEDYHQDYLTLHPKQPYIVFNDLPKIENLKKLFAADYRDKPALVRGPRVSN